MDIHYLINYKPNSNDSFSLVTNNDDMNEREFKKINKNKKKMKGSLGNEKRVVKLSTDPQSVAARERRHKISERFKILRSLVPGGTKMDTASMLEEAIQYVKFLKAQIWLHQTMINRVDHHHDHHVTCHDHHHHHVLASDQQYHLSSQENDYLVMTQMYGHTCFYGHDQCLEDAMSFNTSINYN